MTTALWCVLIAALLPYLATSIAKAGGERYSNRDPRAWLEKQEGWRRRADNAQKNSFEAFPFFAVAVVVAQMLQAPQDRIDQYAVIFIAARIAYIGCYVAGWHWVRSIVWLIGLICCVIIFALAA